jgi:hypothetical protein
VNKGYPGPLNARLEKWVNEFADDDFSHKHPAKDALAFYVEHKDVPANLDVLCQRLQKVLEDLRA